MSLILLLVTAFLVAVAVNCIIAFHRCQKRMAELPIEERCSCLPALVKAPEGEDEDAEWFLEGGRVDTAKLHHTISS